MCYDYHKTLSINEIPADIIMLAQALYTIARPRYEAGDESSMHAASQNFPGCDWEVSVIAPVGMRQTWLISIGQISRKDETVRVLEVEPMALYVPGN